LCAVGMFDDPKLFRHLVVEALMDPSQEFDGCGAGQGALAMHLVDGPLNDDVRPGLKGEGTGFFLKLGQRRALAIAKVSAAGRVAFAGAAVKSARIVLGAVAVTAVRAASAEAFLEGKELTPETIAEAGRLAAGDSRAIADIRSTAAYRDEMAGLLVARGLERLAASRS